MGFRAREQQVLQKWGLDVLGASSEEEARDPGKWLCTPGRILSLMCRPKRCGHPCSLCLLFVPSKTTSLAPQSIPARPAVQDSLISAVLPGSCTCENKCVYKSTSGCPKSSTYALYGAVRSQARHVIWRGDDGRSVGCMHHFAVENRLTRSHVQDAGAHWTTIAGWAGEMTIGDHQGVGEGGREEELGAEGLGWMFVGMALFLCSKIFVPPISKNKVGRGCICSGKRKPRSTQRPVPMMATMIKTKETFESDQVHNRPPHPPVNAWRKRPNGKWTPRDASTRTHSEMKTSSSRHCETRFRWAKPSFPLHFNRNCETHFPRTRHLASSGDEIRIEPNPLAGIKAPDLVHVVIAQTEAANL